MGSKVPKGQGDTSQNICSVFVILQMTEGSQVGCRSGGDGSDGNKKINLQATQSHFVAYHLSWDRRRQIQKPEGGP